MMRKNWRCGEQQDKSASRNYRCQNNRLPGALHQAEPSRDSRSLSRVHDDPIRRRVNKQYVTAE